MKPSLLPLLLPLTPMSGMIFRSEWGKTPAFLGGSGILIYVLRCGTDIPKELND
jgi:hypothetical protein